jgi:hypothetical protein
MVAFRRSVHAGRGDDRRAERLLAIENYDRPEAAENPKLKAKFREIRPPGTPILLSFMNNLAKTIPTSIDGRGAEPPERFCRQMGIA